jgi:thioredoxin 1
MLSQIQSDQQFYEVINQPNTLIEFFAPWCPHCQAFFPILENYAQNVNPNLPIYQVNIDVYQKLCMEYNIQGYPTLLYFSNGSLISEHEGAMDENGLADFVAQCQNAI